MSGSVDYSTNGRLYCVMQLLVLLVDCTSCKVIFMYSELL